MAAIVTPISNSPAACCLRYRMMVPGGAKLSFSAGSLDIQGVAASQLTAANFKIDHSIGMKLTIGPTAGTDILANFGSDLTFPRGNAGRSRLVACGGLGVAIRAASWRGQPATC
jgi:hypothetical protein